MLNLERADERGEMMKNANLAEAKATLWQAYCLLESVITADAQADELSNVFTALHGIKSLMFIGLEELEEV